MGEAVYKKHIVHSSNEDGSLRTQSNDFMSEKNHSDDLASRLDECRYVVIVQVRS